jgi:hypothetical protein
MLKKGLLMLKLRVIRRASKERISLRARGNISSTARRATSRLIALN